MAKLHAEIQKEVKEYLESFGWYVIENKKGKQSKYYKSGAKGMADLLAIKPMSNIYWIEIKTENDIQKPDQIEFEKYVKSIDHKYFLTYGVNDIKGLAWSSMI